MPLIRLNKYLAQLGVASRRQIDQITIGRRITINGRTAILGDKVDPETDTVVVDKKIISAQPQQLVYYALNKPKFILSTIYFIIYMNINFLIELLVSTSLIKI